MGITTELFQQLNRTFVSQRAEKDFFRKQKTKLKNHLYNKFYNKFSDSQENNPDNIYSYFIQPDIQTKILQPFNELDISTRLETYNSVLKKVYNQFKTNYKMNFSTENIEKESITLMKEYLKLDEQHQKILAQIEKQKEIQNKLLNERKKIKQRGKLKILGGLFIGGRLASKRYKKMKY